MPLCLCTYMCISKTEKNPFFFFFSPVFNCPIVKLTEELFPYVLNFSQKFDCFKVEGICTLFQISKQVGLNFFCCSS